MARTRLIRAAGTTTTNKIRFQWAVLFRRSTIHIYLHVLPPRNATRVRKCVFISISLLMSPPILVRAILLSTMMMVAKSKCRGQARVLGSDGCKTDIFHMELGLRRDSLCLRISINFPSTICKLLTLWTIACHNPIQLQKQLRKSTMCQ